MFAHLHMHSHFSLQDGIAHIDKIVDRALELNFKYLAITEHGNINSAIKFYKACTKKGIEPILGLEAYFVNNRFSKQEKRGFHITLLATNKEGFRNLIRINNLAWIEGFYYVPRIDIELLKKYNEGLICLSGCMKSPIAQSILLSDMGAAKEYIKLFQSIFGERYYLELMNHNLTQQKTINDKSLELAEEYRLKCVPTNDVHYLMKEDAHIQDIMFTSQTGRDIHDPNRPHMTTQEFYMKSEDEMRELFGSLCDNTLEIAEQVKIRIRKDGFKLVSFENKEDKLDSLVKKGIEERLIGKYDKTYLDRIDYELKVIKEANITDYMLLVADYVNWAKENNILIGPCRGSIGGSLIGYLLKIHDLDPIQYKLFFSRFYNPGRKKSLPDIDIDFSTKLLSKVKSYVTSKYGYDKFTHIGTFGTLQVKAAIKLVCRVYKIPFDISNEFSSWVGDHKNFESLLTDKSIQTKIKENKEFSEVVKQASQLEGCIVSIGIHAAGMFISPEDLIDQVPLRKVDNVDNLVCTWDMEDIEDLGFVKIDFLSLDTLDIIADVLFKTGIKLEDIPLNDQETYKNISSGYTTGIFQLSSAGIARLAKEMKVESIEDISAVVALFRPGPLCSELDKIYLRRKHGLEKVTYLHPKLEPALNWTYGVLVYQEQIIRILMDLSHFTEEEADHVRKVIGKKLDPKELKESGKHFIEQSTKNNIPKDIAQEIWNQILPFAGYSFNFSHSIGYSMLTYYTAYLKTHYPGQFMCASLNGAIGKPNDTSTYIRECKRLGIQLMKPTINVSSELHKYYPVDKVDYIIWGLLGIKGVGQKLVNNIEKANYNKTFESLIDFCSRVNIDIEAFRNLVKSGYFDNIITNIKLTRKSIVNNAEDIIRISKLSKTPASLLPGFTNEVTNLNISKEEEYTIEELASMEFEVLGFSDNLYNELEEEWIHKNTNIVDDIVIGTKLQVAGRVSEIKHISTKKHQPMCFGKLMYDHSELRFVVFPGVYRRLNFNIVNNQVISVYGEMKLDNKEELNLIVSEVKSYG